MYDGEVGEWAVPQNVDTALPSAASPTVAAGNRKKRPLDAKASGWLAATPDTVTRGACRAVAEVAARVVSVADRKADIYEHFDGEPMSWP